jgi:hypothetical protein
MTGLHNLYSKPNNVVVIKQRTVGLTGSVDIRMHGKPGETESWLKKLKKCTTWETLKNNINVNPREIGCEDAKRIKLTQDIVQGLL